MTNRFTNQLLNIEDDCGLIADAARIIIPGRGLYVAIDVEVDFGPMEYTEYIGTKAMIVCLLAAFSDEDMDELIINWCEN